MYVRVVPVNANCHWHTYHPIQPDPTRVSAQLVSNVYGSRVSGNESVPVRSQGKYSSWHVQPHFTERKTFEALGLEKVGQILKASQVLPSLV